MTRVTKKEAQSALNKARTAAQDAHKAWSEAVGGVDRDATEMHYQRRVRELEEAINDYDQYDTGDD